MTVILPVVPSPTLYVEILSNTGFCLQYQGSPTGRRSKRFGTHEDFSTRRTIEGILVVHDHILMLQIANAFFKLFLSFFVFKLFPFFGRDFVLFCLLYLKQQMHWQMRLCNTASWTWGPCPSNHRSCSYSRIKATFSDLVWPYRVTTTLTILSWFSLLILRSLPMSNTIALSVRLWNIQFSYTEN